MIEIRHLTKKYGSRTAVNDLNITFEKGKIYGFLGPNGAGKSTTMNMITGYLAATEGEVLIDGHDILKEAEKAKKAGNASKENAQQVQKGQRTRGPQKLKFTYQEQKDYETIESDIAALEEKIEKLESEMAAVSTDFVKLNQIMADKEAAESMLNEKMDRWMYLEELAARIAEQ